MAIQIIPHLIVNRCFVNPRSVWAVSSHILETPCATIKGIEVIRALRKDQGAGYTLGEMR